MNSKPPRHAENGTSQSSQQTSWLNAASNFARQHKELFGIVFAVVGGGFGFYKFMLERNDGRIAVIQAPLEEPRRQPVTGNGNGNTTNTMAPVNRGNSTVTNHRTVNLVAPPVHPETHRPPPAIPQPTAARLRSESAIETVKEPPQVHGATQQGSEANDQGPAHPLAMELVSLMRDRSNLRVSLSIRNVYTQSVTLLAPPKSRNPCGVSATDDGGKVYVPLSGHVGCSIKTAMSTWEKLTPEQKLEQATARGETVEANEQTTVTYTLVYRGGSTPPGDIIKHLRADVYVAYRGSSGRPEFRTEPFEASEIAIK